MPRVEDSSLTELVRAAAELEGDVPAQAARPAGRLTLKLPILRAPSADTILDSNVLQSSEEPPRREAA